MLFEELDYGLVVGVIGLGFSPDAEELIALSVGQQRQLGKSGIGLVRNTFEQNFEMREQAVNGCRVEQVGVEFG